MYTVKTHNPHKTKGQEYYANKVLAMIRRDQINATTDEFTGATLEAITMPDMVTTNPLEVKLQGGGCAHQAEFEIMIDGDLNLAISFKAENGGDILHQAESNWDLMEFGYHDYTTQTDHENIQMAADTIAELKNMVNMHMVDIVREYAEEEWMVTQ